MGKQFLRERKESITIYVIVHPFEDEFYIDFTTSKNLRSVYSNHYNLKNEYTKKLFEQFRYDYAIPKFYPLESLIASKPIAYAHAVAWTKFLILNNFTCIGKKSYISDSEFIFDEAEKHYCEIENTNIEKLFYEKNRLFPNYGRERRNKRELEYNPNVRDVQINIRVTQEEFELIQSNAKKCGRVPSAYIRECALYCQPIIIDYREILDLMKEVSQIKNELNTIVRTAVSSGQWHPIDIQTVVDLEKEIVEKTKMAVSYLEQSNGNMYKRLKKIMERNVKIAGGKIDDRQDEAE